MRSIRRMFRSRKYRCSTLAVLGLFLSSACGDAGNENPSDSASTTDGNSTNDTQNQSSDSSGTSTDPDLFENARADYIKYCALCHANDGSGYTADGANALNHPDFLKLASNELIRSGIARGRTPGTPMSAWSQHFGGPLSDPQLDGLVSYIRSWQTTPSIDTSGITISGSPFRGQAAYDVHCMSCHGENGSGTPYMSLNHPDFLAHANDGYLLTSIQEGRPGTPMPGFQDTLSTQTQHDLVALIRSWQRPIDDLPGDMPENDLSQSILNPDGPEPDFPAEGKFIGVDALKAALDVGSRLIILDARPSSDWIAQRIEGARSLPFFDAEKNASLVPNDAWIVTYCGCPHAASEAAADALIASGKTRVKVLDEGFWVWIERGYPTVSGNGEMRMQ